MKKKILVSTFLFSLLSAMSVNLYAEPTSISVCNVKSFNNDGENYTMAFEEAIECSEQNGLPIYVPKGNYFIDSPIILNDQNMVGEINGAFGGNNTDGTELESYPTLFFSTSINSDAIILNGASSIKGFSIKFVDDNWDSTSQPNPFSAIKVQGIGVNLSHLRMDRPYYGINAPVSHNTGRLNIENVFIIAPQYGVHIGYTLDVSRLRGIHVWNPGTIRDGSIGFWFKKNDYMATADLSVFNMATAYKFQDLDSHGGSIISMTGTISDFCAVGLSIRGTAKISLTGGTIINHYEGIKITDSARIQANGVQFQSNGSPIIQIDGQADLTVSGCHFERTHSNFQHPAIFVKNGNLITITGNTFFVRGHAIYFETPAKKASSITGNTFDLTLNTHARYLWGNYGDNNARAGNSSTQ